VLLLFIKNLLCCYCLLRICVVLSGSLTSTSCANESEFEKSVMIACFFIVFNATFNNISVISWRSVLFVEETGENHWQNLSHNVVSSTHQHERGSNARLLVAIGTDCTGSCKSNHHTTTTALSGEVTNTNFIVFGLTWTGLLWTHDLSHSRRAG
jgi:hypothetical protein